MKRGASGLSLVVGVDKPIGMSSHDVVNCCRRVFSERRVGHTGTLDPLASGVLPILVGPATRLDAYFVGHDKKYFVTISFGVSTTTDDAEGDVLERVRPQERLLDEKYAMHYLDGIVGCHKQMPPAYSAIKRDGKKACDEARNGRAIVLEARDIEIYSATLVNIAQPSRDEVQWNVELHVSKGTYIRSIARDAGRDVGCPAHVAALRRIATGSLEIGECVSLDVLEREGAACALDPVPLLGLRAFFAGEAERKSLVNGGVIAAQSVALYDVSQCGIDESLASCTSSFARSLHPPIDKESVSVLSAGRLAAIYRFDGTRAVYKPACVFSTGVSRGVVI